MSGRRFQGTTPARLAVIVVATVLGGTTAAVSVIGSNALEPRLTAAASTALRDAGFDAVQVRFDGREAFLSGRDATDRELEEAADLVAGLDGVRWAVVSDPSSAEDGGPDPAPSPTQPDPTAPALSAEERAQLEDTSVLFAANGIALDAEARDLVDEVARLLERDPGLRIRLVGHIAIVTGTPAEVREVCERRAQAVVDALVAAGIDADRLEIRSAGDTEPIADNATPAGAALNRRVTIEILEAG